jgi:hypothetical protein
MNGELCDLADFKFEFLKNAKLVNPMREESLRQKKRANENLV